MANVVWCPDYQIKIVQTNQIVNYDVMKYWLFNVVFYQKIVVWGKNLPNFNNAGAF